VNRDYSLSEEEYLPWHAAPRFACWRSRWPALSEEEYLPWHAAPRFSLLALALAGCDRAAPPATNPLLRDAGLTAAEEKSIQEWLGEIVREEVDMVRCQSDGAAHRQAGAVGPAPPPGQGGPPGDAC